MTGTLASPHCGECAGETARAAIEAHARQDSHNIARISRARLNVLNISHYGYYLKRGLLHGHLLLRVQNATHDSKDPDHM